MRQITELLSFPRYIHRAFCQLAHLPTCPLAVFSPRTPPFLLNLNLRMGDDVKAKVDAFIDAVPRPANLKLPAMQRAIKVEAMRHDRTAAIVVVEIMLYTPLIRQRVGHMQYICQSLHIKSACCRQNMSGGAEVGIWLGTADRVTVGEFQCPGPLDLIKPLIISVISGD